MVIYTEVPAREITRCLVLGLLMLPLGLRRLIPTLTKHSHIFGYYKSVKSGL